ncbi:hypothetical protein [Pleionea sp. CnH1-48]|uniref:hypothetical protein n=1 Tax=Pleionea sp. CnH1-48 TaxID=2954494 RepID=UPI00209790E9|nr:hypothetical protein [Pleionea sp. CnH1-48]MCO7226564.1 hypothetical protein [Pleionea sp. CnH1-48]
MSYQVLADINIEHEFFDYKPCRALNLEFNETSKKRLFNADVMAINRKSSIQLLMSPRSLRVINAYIRDNESNLVIKVHASDPLFYNFTKMNIKNGKTTYYLSNEKGDNKVDGVINLHKEESLSDSDLISIDSKDYTDLFSERDFVNTPLAVIEISLKSLLEQSDNSNNTVYYKVYFESRKTYWKYWLIDNSGGNDYSIIDLDDNQQFSFLGTEVIDNNKRASVYMSKLPIALKQYSNVRLQLKETKSDFNRVIVKRLPVASNRQINSSVLDGEKVDVSEIFVNL